MVESSVRTYRIGVVVDNEIKWVEFKAPDCKIGNFLNVFLRPAYKALMAEIKSKEKVH